MCDSRSSHSSSQQSCVLQSPTLELEPSRGWPSRRNQVTEPGERGFMDVVWLPGAPGLPSFTPRVTYGLCSDPSGQLYTSLIYASPVRQFFSKLHCHPRCPNKLSPPPPSALSELCFPPSKKQYSSRSCKSPKHSKLLFVINYSQVFRTASLCGLQLTTRGRGRLQSAQFLPGKSCNRTGCLRSDNLEVRASTYTYHSG